MAPTTAALGEGLWEQHGGTVVRCTHPSGRTSFTYVSPRGDKFRSWKQCLTYIEEINSDSSPPELQKHPHTLSKAHNPRVRSASPTHFQKQHNGGGGNKFSGGINSIVVFESSSPEDESDFRPTFRISNGTLKKSSALRPTACSPASVARHSLHAPDTTAAGRRRNLLDSSPQRKVVSPSTFTGANMPGRNPSLLARPVPPSANLLVRIPYPPSDHGSPAEAEHVVPKAKSSKKIKSDPRVTDSRKRPLSGGLRKRIEDSQKVAEMPNPEPRIPNPASGLVPDSRARSSKGVRHNHGKKRCDDDDSDAEVDAQLQFCEAKRTNPDLSTPVEIQQPVMDKLSGRKRARESGRDHEEDQDSDYCNSDTNENGSDYNEDMKVYKRAVSRPRRAAAGTNFKEERIHIDEKESLIVVKEEKTVDDEEVAVVLTAQPGEDQTPQRRLLDFVIHDESGDNRSVEHIDDGFPLYISSLVLPNTSVVDKEKGVRCDGFGPIVSWWIMGYEKNSPAVCFCTELAEYYCVKPAGVYKKLFNILFDKAKVCIEVYRSLSQPEGGDPLLPLDDLIGRVSRSFSKQGGPGQFFNREFMINNGKFVVTQLTALDVNAGDHQQLFSGLPALISLEQEAERRFAFTGNLGFPVKNGALTIREESSRANGDGSGGADSTSDSMQEDELLARLLQEEDERAFSSKPARRAPTSKGKYYIKINETEIANDYPLPAYYMAEEEEMDEYILFDEIAVEYPEDLPHRKIHDWTLYNSDSRLVSLELLPMLRGAETDMEIFGSGVITEDDGSGFCLDGETAEGSKESSSVDAGGSNGNEVQEGIRVYLSAVKEWKIEFGASMLFISFRTDGAWYRLGKPSQQYLRWYEPVLKTARLAVNMITMLKEASRVNRLSLNDVIKKLANQSEDEPTYISSKVPEVERYVMAHGQIILQQFAEYPDEGIKRSAFITGLASKMEQLSHTKLILTKKKVLLKKGRNLNPRANLCPDGHKRKPMRATTTRLVDRIWSAYYAGTTEAEGGEGAIPEITEKEPDVVEEELVEESDDEETVEIKSSVIEAPKKQSKGRNATCGNVQFVDKPVGKTPKNEPVYLKAISDGTEYMAGKAVVVNRDDDTEYSERPPAILLIEYLYEGKSDVPMAHGRLLERGWETILGNAANEREVFLTDACENVEIEKISGLVTVELRQRDWGHQYRKFNAMKDEADRISAKEREKKGLPLEYFCRSWYSPERGAFFSLPTNSLALGSGICTACETRHAAEEKLEVQILAKDEGFRLQGVEYRINDYLYLDPDTFVHTLSDPNEKVLFKGGRNKGLRAFAICQLLSVLPSPKGNSKKASRPMKIRRFYRPEDVDKMKAYKADIHEVYYSDETSIVDIATVRGKCLVRRQVHEVAASEKCAVNHVFFCSCIHDSKTGTVKQLPLNFKLSSGSSLEATTGKSQAEEIAAKAKGKGKAIQSEPAAESVSESALATLDIFAGCGGLSEGLHQSGVSATKWAIEYDNPAAEAFKLNHPTADVFCENCNVILRSVMEIGSDLDDCVSTPEADEMSLKLDKEKKLRLPKPGEVDFISGGPPCQGFSGMNRFNERAWSKVQCEMILSFLSYAEYFRPRYFLLENVRNFVSFNKGQTFRLSLASLLEMGYQVRFGVLQAGNYGVAQSRKRAFIWASAPGETLPEWPEPRYVFSSSQLGITLPGGFQYAAVRDAARGAPFRPITVRDTVGDLPPVENGANKGDIPYTKLPESWFQGEIRGEQTHLIDHISKEMNELNTIRCQRIPKEPGSDWRCLPEEKVKLSTGQVVDLIPWCLPNTADRHNQWKGLFGRLDWDGNFPTSITDPQPMGKVGMCFHPEQDRIVTVRECARSQGFPDSYNFFGNINSKHRQIGNAVPPPLARALGHMLKEAIRGR